MKSYSTSELEALSEFVSHVDSLSKLRFASRISSKSAFILRGTKTEPMDFFDLDEDDCRSFLLGIRLLVQDRDGISLKKIWEILASVDDLELLKTINNARAPVFLSMDCEAMFADPDGKTITNQDIFDTFMYGAYAHFDKMHRTRFKYWRKSTRFPFLKLIFLMSVNLIYQRSIEMAGIVRAILRKRREKGSGEYSCGFIQ